MCEREPTRDRIRINVIAGIRERERERKERRSPLVPRGKRRTDFFIFIAGPEKKL